MERGNARQLIVRGDDARARLLPDLERTVNRTDWQVLAFVLMDNHFHVLLKSPGPNLSNLLYGCLGV